jgi:tRNA dimethylallyltransferase
LRALKALLIAGPTAGGKSAVAKAIARHFDGVVINADSMQVYRELSVLTARPTPEDTAAVSHQLYGHVFVRDQYSVARWLGDVEQALAEARQVRKLPVITGGTGLYFRALLRGLSPIPQIDPGVRAHWRAKAMRLAPGELHAILRARDPVTATGIRSSDRQRVTRALEVLDSTGTPLAVWQQRPGLGLLSEGETARIVVSPDRAELHRRCEARFDAMLATGAVEEVAALLRMDLPHDATALKALGVGPLSAHLQGEMSLAEASTRAKSETRQYAKRQLTWLRRFMADWRWITALDPQDVLSEILRALDAAGCRS